MNHLLYIDNLVLKFSRKHLDTLQKQIVEMLLKELSYREIAEKLGYNEGYIGDKARLLFKILSISTGEAINKSNFSWVIERLNQNNPKELEGNLIDNEGELKKIKIIENNGIIDILLIGSDRNDHD